jgi:hypothetical protein
MIFTIPKSSRDSQVKITARTSRGPAWELVARQDNSISTFQFDLPANINVDDLEVFVEFVRNDGQIDHVIGATVLKTMKRMKLPSRSQHVSR